jgi:LuxR family maltose regulon positive regulatory protein
LLRRHPDTMIATVACLVTARKALAEGDPDTSLQITQQARQGGQVPAWLLHRLALLESRACAAAGDTRSALAAAQQAGPASLEVTAAVASAWLAAGDLQTAKDALTSYQEGTKAVADQARLEAWLAAAQISYRSGDRADGRRSLQRALRLGEPQRLRLPFVLAGTWLRHVLQADPDLAHVYQDLLGPELAGPGRELAPRAGTNPPAPVLLEPLTSREREVLRQASEMLDTTEIADALYISVNTVKSHFKSIYRKLAVTHRNEAVRRALQLHVI